jgi:proteasome lid subunit RPN8/RPN11
MSGDAKAPTQSGALNQPWIAGELTIDKAVLEAIQQHALDTFPKECCGFASGPASEPHVITASVRETNEADKYHRLDPVTFPRTAETYFKINELRAAKAFEEGDKSGQPIKVIYHSHCNAGAYFSKEDAATFAADNTLMWPCAFIVVSVMKEDAPILVPKLNAKPKGKLAETKLWVHVPGTNEFKESVLTVR